MKTDPNMLRTVLLTAIVALAVGAPPAFAEGAAANPCKPAVEKKEVKKDEKNKTETTVNPCAPKSVGGIPRMIGDK